jgi:hypothetical protein
MIVKSAHCSWGMHLKGKTTYNLPTIEGTPEVPVTTATGYVKLDYGDCCCFSRHAVLKFKVSGDLGYKKTSWDPKTK